MPPSLLNPPSQLSPSAALQLSQQAPNFLSESPSTVSSSPFALFSAPESPELWIKCENLLLSCLRTGDERAAQQCLERLTTRFGATNERIMALAGLVKEADAQNPGDFEKVLKEYDDILSEDSANIVRRVPPAIHHKLLTRDSLSPRDASPFCDPWVAHRMQSRRWCSS